MGIPHALGGEFFALTKATSSQFGAPCFRDEICGNESRQAPHRLPAILVNHRVLVAVDDGLLEDGRRMAYEKPV